MAAFSSLSFFSLLLILLFSSPRFPSHLLHPSQLAVGFITSPWLHNSRHGAYPIYLPTSHTSDNPTDESTPSLHLVSSSPSPPFSSDDLHIGATNCRNQEESYRSLFSWHIDKLCLRSQNSYSRLSWMRASSSCIRVAESRTALFYGSAAVDARGRRKKLQGFGSRSKTVIVRIWIHSCIPLIITGRA